MFCVFLVFCFLLADLVFNIFQTIVLRYLHSKSASVPASCRHQGHLVFLGTNRRAARPCVLPWCYIPMVSVSSRRGNSVLSQLIVFLNHI